MPAADSSTSLCPQCQRPLGSRVGGLCAQCLGELAFFAGQELPQETPTTVPLALGDYELLEEIGRGGTGVVYRARQRGLGRLVALKVIPAGPLADPAAVSRFRAEARAAAALHHPHVVRVHEVAEDGEHAFFSMDLVEGRSLAERVRETGPLAPKDAAALVAKVASGLQHAHDRGLLHRDIKPANILLDAAEEPRVADFGLATPLAGRAGTGLTLTHHTVGTPGYLAPEQAVGHEPASVRTDVYGLGGTLYFALTGRAPLSARSVTAFLADVQHREPPAPRLLDPSLPRDLETICLKCLEKSPARRYATAADVAADLGRFLADEPISARPLGPAGRTWRWMRRHRALSASLSALFLLLGGSALALSALWWRAERATAAESYQRGQAESELWASLIATARGENRSGLGSGTVRALAAVRRAAAIRVDASVRDEAIAAISRSDVVTLDRVTWGVATLQQLRDPILHPTLRCASMLDRDGRHQLVDARTGRVLRTLDGPPVTTADADSFSPSGRYLVTCHASATAAPASGTAGNVSLWTSEDGQPVPLTTRPGVLAVRWTADESALALLRAEEVEMLAMPAGTPLRRFPLAPGWRGPALSPSGDRLAVSRAAAVELLSTADGSLLKSLPHPAQPESPAWNADGTLLTVGCHDSLVYVWDTATGTEWARCNGHDGLPVWQEFLPGTDWFLSAGWDHTVRLWEARTGRQLLVVTGDDQTPVPNGGGRLVSFSRWPAVVLSQVQAPSVVHTLREPLRPADPRSGVQDVAFSRDGALLFTAGDPGGIAAWDATTLEPIGSRPSAAVHVMPQAGNSLLCTGRGGLRRLTWKRTDDGKLAFASPVPAGPTDFTNHASATPDGGTVACGVSTQAAPYGRHVQIWRAGACTAAWEVPAYWPTIALSPDGQWTATGGTGGCRLGLFRTADGSPVTLGSDPSQTLETSSLAVAFSPDSRTLTSQGARLIRLWDVPSGQCRASLERPSGSLDRLVAFSPDGRLLAAAGVRRDVWLIDPARGERLCTLTSPVPAMLAALAFSPDGRHLAVAMANRTVVLWNLAALREWLRSEHLDWSDAP